MSPRASSSAGPSSSSARNASAPYTRRPAGQPKSTRQQFSACGACRMRRVRCDLKDLPYTTAGPHPSCSNCKERGLKCVDEFADVKAVKLLRRGRRLQQVEAIYGKQNGASSSTTPPETRLPSIIPQLTTEFFLSPFWKWFCVQRPILDPFEFPSRFISHTKGITTLGHEGGLLAMMLVIWAASFGLNERGQPDSDDAGLYQGEEDDASPSPGTSPETRGKEMSRKQRKNFKEKTDAMLREVLELIDFHGVLRRPTWDGVRVLLLLLPLMEDAHQLERIAMHEATLSQAQALCMSTGPASMLQPFPEHVDNDILRAQIFWYGHVYEGVVAAMRGHRLILNNDDFETFQNNLAHMHNNHNNSGFPSPPPSSSGLRPMSSQGLGGHKNSQSFNDLSNLFGLPLHMSALGRKVHIMLTGNKAMKRAEEHGLVDARGMEEIWEDLDVCWQDFEVMRRLRTDAFDVEQYVSAWQIFIFECHNIIRETLRQYTSLAASNALGGPSRPSSHSSSSPYLSPQHLHAIATRKCLSLLPATLSMIRYHLSLDKTLPGGGLFTWDAGLVRDGCYYAGYLSASVEGDTIEFPTDERDDEITRARAHMSCEDAVTLCIEAISEMRWAFSKSDEREESLRSLWEEKQAGRNTLRYRGGQDPSSTYARSLSNSMPATHATTFNALTDFDRRPSLPPINLIGSPRRVESAPNTGYSTTGHGANGWPSYTPPGTGNSVATSATGISRGSPAFHGMPSVPSGLKNDLNETFYHVSHDLDQFTFHPPAVGGALTEATLAAAAAQYHHADPPGSSHSIHGMAAASSYLGPGMPNLW